MRNRKLKRKFPPAYEVQLWEEIFATGNAGFFADWQELGFKNEEEALAGAEAAWARLGALFMATSWPLIRHPSDDAPWAIKKFGGP